MMDTSGARTYIAEKLVKAGDYAFLPEGVLGAMLDRLLALDAAFMEDTGVNDGAAYDDDEALDYIFSGMAAAFPEHKMYMKRLAEDYLDLNEEYLESIGAIEWE